MSLSSKKDLPSVQQAGTRPESGWRSAVVQIYYVCLAFIGIALVFVFPPHFDRHPATVASVLFIAIFLAVMERPVRAAGLIAAPITSVMGASVILFGWWTLALVVVTFAAVHLRINQPTLVRWLAGFTGQVGLGFIAVYIMMATWNVIHKIIDRTTSIENVLLMLFGTLFVAAIWQIVNNTAAYPAMRLVNQPFPWFQLFRVGFLAALYAYLFVALYNFGGLVAATLLYVVLAQHRIVTEVVGVTGALQKLDRAREQARNLVADLMRFRDTDTVKFSSDVRSIAQRMGRRLGMSRTEIATLGLAAELHEIGLSRLPSRLRQTANLNSLELEQLKTFPRVGAHMVREADALLPKEIADWIESQGEHYDGSGYPRGLIGDEIPLQSRIIALARDYVRLVGEGGHASMDGKERALAELRERTGIVYDPKLFSTLADIV